MSLPCSRRDGGIRKERGHDLDRPALRRGTRLRHARASAAAPRSGVAHRLVAVISRCRSSASPPICCSGRPASAGGVSSASAYPGGAAAAPGPLVAETTPSRRPSGAYAQLFSVGRSISGFDPVGGNRARLLADSNATIDAMVADIDAARGSCPSAVLHLAAGQQRLQGGRGAEARGRGAVSPAGPWPTTWARGRLIARSIGRPCGRPACSVAARAADRQSAAAAAARAASICATTARSSSSTIASPIAAARTAPIRSSSSRRSIAPWVDAVMRFEGPDRPAEPAPVRQRLDGVRGRGHRPTCCSSRMHAAAAGLHRAGDRHRADRALLGHARDVRDADVRGAPRTGHHHALLRARRVACRPRFALPRYRGVETTIIFPGPQRLVDRRRGQPQLLRRPAGRRRYGSTSTWAACCTPSR